MLSPAALKPTHTMDADLLVAAAGAVQQTMQCPEVITYSHLVASMITVMLPGPRWPLLCLASRHWDP